MASIDQRIKETEDKLQETPVNKATEKERARLKSKLASLREKKEKKQTGTGGGDGGYSVKKKGDATVALVGLPSTGKSTLINKLTNAQSDTADYEFTTLKVIPGIMKYKGAQIQILDVPGLIGGAAKGKGRGKEVLSVIRNADMVLILTDKERLDSLNKIEQELYRAGIRLDQTPPQIKIEKAASGGINISATVDLDLEEDTIKQVLRDNGYLNCKIIIREAVDIDRLLDGIKQNRVYLPSLTAINKVDLLDNEELEELRDDHPSFVFISAEEEENLPALREKIWQKLRLMRIYMKKRGKEADKEEPLIINEESTVKEAANKIPQGADNLDYARIWGPSAKFPGQRVGKDHKLEDEDVLELHY